MGSATVQGQLWGTNARDWAAYGEQICLPLQGAALDAAHVTAGTRLLDAGCGAGLLVLASLAVNTTVAAAATYFEGRLPLPAAVLQIFNFLVSFGLMITLFTLIYKTVPDAYVAWGDAWVGAVVTAFLFNVGTMGLSLFLGTAGGSSLYGTAASVLALLMWVYYSAQVFFFGAEVTRIFATTYGGGIVPHHRSLGRFWHRRPADGLRSSR